MKLLKPDKPLKGKGKFDATGVAVPDVEATAIARAASRIARASVRRRMQVLGLSKHKGGNGKAMARDKRVPLEIVVDTQTGRTVGQLRRAISTTRKRRLKLVAASKRRNRR